MQLLNSKTLMNVTGGDYVGGICHISEQGYNTQAFVSFGNPDTIQLQGGTKQVTNGGLGNTGLLNHASGPLSQILQPSPGC